MRYALQFTDNAGAVKYGGQSVLLFTPDEQTLDAAHALFGGVTSNDGYLQTDDVAQGTLLQYVRNLGPSQTTGWIQTGDAVYIHVTPANSATAPQAPPGYVAASGAVDSLNGLTGAVVADSPDDSVTITTGSGGLHFASGLIFSSPDNSVGIEVSSNNVGLTSTPAIYAETVTVNASIAANALSAAVVSAESGNTELNVRWNAGSGVMEFDYPARLATANTLWRVSMAGTAILAATSPTCEITPLGMSYFETSSGGGNPDDSIPFRVRGEACSDGSGGNESFGLQFAPSGAFNGKTTSFKMAVEVLARV